MCYNSSNYEVENIQIAARHAKMSQAEGNQLRDALVRLNQIGGAVNRLGSGHLANVQATLKLIVESATEVVPGTSAVIYTYDQRLEAFDPGSRVSAEGHTQPSPNDYPRADGIGARAVRLRRRVLSYDETDLNIHPAKEAVGAQVMCGFPLIAADEVLGALYVYRHEADPFSELELLTLDNFVNQAAITLYLARQLTRAQKEQATRSVDLRRLHRAGMLISTPSSVQETLDAILAMTLEFMEARHGIFRLVDRTGSQLITRAFAGEGLEHPLLEALPIDGNSIMGSVAMSKEPLVIGDLRQKPYADVYYPLDPEFEMRSELAVPLIGAGGRLEGVLNLESPRVNAFNQDDQYILQILATQAVIAIQRARLLNALQEISALLLTKPLPDFFEYLVLQASDLLNAEDTLICLLDGDHLMVSAATDKQLQGTRIDLDNSLIGQVVLSAEPLASHDLRNGAQFSQDERLAKRGWTSVLAVPIMSSKDRDPFGNLSVFGTQMAPLTLVESEWDLKVLTILGYYAALAIQNEAHQKALQKSQEQRAVAEAFAAIGDIAANLLHRLNNKVGTIPVRVEGIMAKGHPNLIADPYIQTNLKEIDRSATEAMEIVRESLFHLRPVTLVPVNVSQCVQLALGSLEIPGEIEIVQEGLAELPEVTAGEQRLVLVFINLIENAIDAMAGSGQIRLQGAVEDRWVVVSISDNGPGIPLDRQEIIFEFSYSGRSGSRPTNLGFGLWWVKSLMARFGGSIQVESEEGQGTKFSLQIPLAKIS